MLDCVASVRQRRCRAPRSRRRPSRPARRRGCSEITPKRIARIPTSSDQVRLRRARSAGSRAGRRCTPSRMPNDPTEVGVEQARAKHPVDGAGVGAHEVASAGAGHASPPPQLPASVPDREDQARPRRRRARRAPGSSPSGGRRGSGRSCPTGARAWCRRARPPKRRAARPTPTAVLRPSRATAIPRKPIDGCLHVDRAEVVAGSRACRGRPRARRTRPRSPSPGCSSCGP